MMFLQFFIWGVWYVPMWTFLGTLEIEASLRGTAYAATGVAAMKMPKFFTISMPALSALCRAQTLPTAPTSWLQEGAIMGDGNASE